MARLIGVGAIAGRILAGLFQPGMPPVGTQAVADTVSADDEFLTIPGGAAEASGTAVDTAIAAVLITGADTAAAAGVDTGKVFNLAFGSDTGATADAAAVTGSIGSGDSGLDIDLAIFGYSGVVPRIGRVARAQPENRTMVVPAEIDGVAA